MVLSVNPPQHLSVSHTHLSGYRNMQALASYTFEAPTLAELCQQKSVSHPDWHHCAVETARTAFSSCLLNAI